MLQYIERLRHESEKTRRRYAFGISLLIVLVIAGIWTVNRLYLSKIPEGVQNPASENPSPLQSVIQTFSAGYANVLSAVKSTPPPTFTAPTSTPKSAEVIITDPAN